eukprot:TRINITY_DN11324_c0_g3_i1.p1 TRINITY_DN11324_c0_g3~~TRINITY_DN11324_c0_g3_i1.p1  ORF type:complete len:1250 (+),score=384.87 TRINITY_DN11324_c0_g3_i1:87-3836(+)
MGCGSSTSGTETKADKRDKGAEGKYKAEEKKGGAVKEPVKNTPDPVKSSQASPHPGTNDVASPKGGAIEESSTSQGREKHMPGPLMATSQLSDEKETTCLICAYGHVSDMSGLTIAVYNVKTHDTYSKSLSDAELTKIKEGLSTPVMEWPIYWKMFASAMNKADVKVTNHGAAAEIRMKSKGEPKEATMSVELQKQTSAYIHFISVMPKIFQQKRKEVEEEAKEEKKDDKKLREVDLSRKEAEYNISESILLAGATAEARLTPVLVTLREEAASALRSLGETTGEIAKTKQEIEKITVGAPSHPLDDLYSCDIPPTAEPKALDVSTLGWGSDVFAMDVGLHDVALALFEYHGITDAFGMDKAVVLNFFSAVERRCHGVPYHGGSRATDCMIVMHFILQALEKTIKFAKEDIMAALICAGILDLDHEGYDDQFIKRAGSMLSMLYSDLYQNTQNNLTVAAELFYNGKLDLLKTLTPDQNKDVIETVREALFIKANVQMKQPMERLQDFRALAASGADWTTKDNIRHAITHAVRMTDWSVWGRPQNVHKKWMEKVAEEYYRQGDEELSLGMAPSSFFNTCWTTERNLHDLTFSRGQATFIDQVVLPLFEEMARLAPDLDCCVADAKANKEVFEKDGGSSGAALKSALAITPKLFGGTTNGVAFARVGPDSNSLWISFADSKNNLYEECFDDIALAKRGVKDTAQFLEEVAVSFRDSTSTSSVSGDKATLSVGNVKLDLTTVPGGDANEIMSYLKSYLELRSLSAMRYVDRKVEEAANKAATAGNKSLALHGEEKALRGCIQACAKQSADLKPKLSELQKELTSKGGNAVKVVIEDALAIKVRNPLKAPLPPGVTEPPDRKDVDPEILKILKSKYLTKEHGSPDDLTTLPDPMQAKWCNAITPYLTSDFCNVTKNIADDKRQRIWDLVLKLDDWDYDVFDLQETMSGGISGENLRSQPSGGALFITAYALMYKWQFMQKFNIDENTLLNWLSIVEAGYHPNPYHNSMHAADVLHVTHYILGPGGCKDKVKATDEEMFAAIFAAAIHDYNHPGINNAFHVRSQNYLAVLFNDRSVNENIHASSVFELMRMEKFNILKAFKGDAYAKMRDDIVEFILGTDMGLHAMILSRFKKRLETTDSKMHKTKADKNLAITMCVKMADISNCGRPQKLYHGWCNVIVDEFFQQGDRERLQGMPVSPFMDRYTTVMAKGQIGFMNYIVMPLFECMGEFLEPMSKASMIAEENKGFWQENEDW